MAEAAGLAIGIGALFTTCIETFKIIFAAQEFARDFEILNSSFQQQRLRLLLWGQSVGIISRHGVKARPYLQELDAEHVRPTVLRSLESVQYLLEQCQVLESRYGFSDAAAGLDNVGNPKAVTFVAVVKRNKKQKSARDVAKWAVFDAEQMAKTIERLKSLIDGIIDITDGLKSMGGPDGTIAMGRASGGLLSRVTTGEKAQEAPQSPMSSKQILALDLHNSVDTFHTAQELLGSIETFDTANCSVSNTTIFSTAEDVRPRADEYQVEGSRDECLASDWTTADWLSGPIETCGPSASNNLEQHKIGATFELPIRPAPNARKPIISAKNVYPSTPSDFADVFPTDKKIFITHDDAGLDGNMNLRMCVSSMRGSSDMKYMSLFHLRMHDLRERDFSFRRYCRDSGREICRSGLQVFQAQSKSSILSVFSQSLTRVNSLSQRSVGNAQQLPSSSARSSRSSMISWFSRRSSVSSHASNASRVSDHGLGHDKAETVVDVVAEQTSRKTIQLEFSNYARVELQRRGRQNRKKYTFAYWGHNYQWKRKVDPTRKISSDCYGHSFDLYREATRKPVAHIEPLKDAGVTEEGWVPPCAMHIVSPEMMEDGGDLSEVIIATGVVALADNAIRSYLTVLVDGETSLRDLAMKDTAS